MVALIGLAGPFAFTYTFSAPYFDSSSIQAETPVPPLSPYPISIGGHDYLADTSFEPYRRDAFRHRSIPSQRQSINLDNIPGEGTVNTEGMWRRIMEDWSLGAGQLFFDKKGSVPNRYYQSKGIDCWTQWQATLLPDTKQVWSGNPIKVLTAGGNVYILTATELLFTSDWNNFSVVTGLPGNLVDMATDGNYVYVTGGTGLWFAQAGSTTSAQFVTTGTLDFVAYCGNRLLVASQNSLYNIVGTQGSVLPAALWTHPNTAFRYTCAAAGSSQIYIGGHVPSHTGIIYRTTIAADGTNLDVPIQALPFGGGEYPTELFSYLNFIFIGTNQGVRMAETLNANDPTGASGDLRVGPLLPNLLQPVTQPVFGITGNNRFVYFGWGPYDSVSSGIGRMDLSNFIDTLAPAYASDLMASAQGQVVSLCWDPINNGPCMAIANSGVWVKVVGGFVSQGNIISGGIAYDLPDDKIAMQAQLSAVQPIPGAVTINLGVDDGTRTAVGSQEPGQPILPMPIGQVRGKKFELEIVLNKGIVNAQEAAPVLERWMLQAIPAVVSGIAIEAVIVAHREIDVNQGFHTTMDPYGEYEFLESLRLSQTLVEYVEGPFHRQVTIDQVEWLPNKRIDTFESGYEGYLTVTMKTWPS